MNRRQELTEQSGGFTGLEHFRNLVLLLMKVECLIAVQLHLTDTAAGDCIRGVNFREKGNERLQISSSEIKSEECAGDRQRW